MSPLLMVGSVEHTPRDVANNLAWQGITLKIRETQRFGSWKYLKLVRLVLFDYQYSVGNSVLQIASRTLV